MEVRDLIMPYVEKGMFTAAEFLHELSQYITGVRSLRLKKNAVLPDEIVNRLNTLKKSYQKSQYKTGRRMNLGDSVQKKSTGEQGTIVDISFDRKLGKFYMIDFGSQTPEIVYETDLMKLKDPLAPIDAMPIPTEVTPGPTKFKGAKRAVLDARFNYIKEAALQFVSGMVNQALQIHEDTHPGQRTTPQLENALTRQAITTYISKYMPTELRQSMSAEDKNGLSEYLLFENAGTTEDVPTANEFTPGENTAMPAQKPEQEIVRDSIMAHMEGHIAYSKANVRGFYSPAKFASPMERNRFIKEAAFALQNAGIEPNTAHLIAQSIITQSSIDGSFIRHALQHQLLYDAKVVDQLIDEAHYRLSNTEFTTTRGQKYALDLPGMETLRGGGGGYPGGMDQEPMGWEVKNPGGPGDPGMLEQSLEEQLMDQTKPFDQAAPKLKIELDQENKKIIIDYNQEEEPVMPIEGADGRPRLRSAPRR